MPRLAATLSMLFPQLAFPDRFAAAAKAGFSCVEYQHSHRWGKPEAAERARLFPRIGQMQSARVPDQHEPDTGEVDVPWRRAHIDQPGYARCIRCEYNPTGDTLSGLVRAKSYL